MFYAASIYPGGLYARIAHTALTCAHRACNVWFVTQRTDIDVQNPFGGDNDGDGDDQGDERGARRRDIRGARRREQILQLLQTVESGSMSVEEIAERFNVSFATVRRDLSRLHQDRHITRTYGGVALTVPAELSIHQRHLEFTREKDAIGRVAAEAVTDGAVVIVDAGTTTEFVARHLTAADVTVFTNGIGAINILARKEHVSLVVLGGRLRRVNETISGAEAENMLRSVVADFAFVGADAVHPEYGVASRTLEQSRLKTLMMQRARQTVVVADHRKLTTDQFNYWSELPANWRFVTDDGAETEAGSAALEELRRIGADIDLAHPLRVLIETAEERGTES
ncbi:DeoR/GlpR family DNA-binding transcription regulator [Mycolicibacterium smegmatis]|uniref:DeoR/GlpR family DNA-binding transcription regulator n=1 Tax=Mycolicibacterium smegmatis TaxID=1772 RepID=UPI001EFC267F|nr:DeoR/GlpR family DNA-binding transcription regulator [Mycolicibacterium smegmatis]